MCVQRESVYRRELASAPVTSERALGAGGEGIEMANWERERPKPKDTRAVALAP